MSCMRVFTVASARIYLSKDELIVNSRYFIQSRSSYAKSLHSLLSKETDFGFGWIISLAKCNRNG